MNKINDTLRTLAVFVAAILFLLMMWVTEKRDETLRLQLATQIAATAAQLDGLKDENMKMRLEIVRLRHDLCEAMDSGRCAK